MNIWVELDKKPFPLETQLSNFGPIKSIYFCVALGKKKLTLKTKIKLFLNKRTRGDDKGSRYLKNLKAHVRNR